MSLATDTRWQNVTESWKNTKGPTKKEYWSLQRRQQGAPTASDPLAQRREWGWTRTDIHVEWFPQLSCWRVVRKWKEKRGYEMIERLEYLARFDGVHKLDEAKHFAEATYMLRLPCQ